jgi:hypothetical protein
MNQPDNQKDPAGYDAALTQAGLILIGFVLLAVIIVVVLVDNSQAPWHVKTACVGVALMGFVSLAGWLD